jgi:signal transduction histidine kinase
MKLRTQILVSLFLFAFVPLFAAFVINLPLVLDRFEHFYHQAHMQNLRADFRDLDQHLASRHELVSLLAKLPEPGSLLPQPFIEVTPDQKTAPPEQTTKDYQSLPVRQYVSWINRIMAEQRDVVLLSFVDKNNQLTHSFLRNRQTGDWEYVEQPPVTITPAPRNPAQPGIRSNVSISPIIIRKEFLQRDPRLFMTLNLSSPIYLAEKTATAGQIIITVNVMDFARYYQNTIWVQSDGQYLFSTDSQDAKTSAFNDFPGLDELFAKDRLALWEGKSGQHAIWVPMLRTATGDPLWVGRRVDSSPISNIQFAISWRVIAIMLVLVGIIYYLASRFAHKAERFDHELIDGISRMLEENEAINLKWDGPIEIQELGEKLSRLSEVHATNTERALSHAHELEASNRYKSEFLANVSHELRTPLNSILLLSKLIKEDPVCSPEQMEKAAVINAAGKDLKSLIDNILDLSRIEAGKTTFSLHHTDVRELLEELIFIMKPQFEAKKLQLALTIEDDLPESIFTDAEKTRQILKNFLSNALKFTDSGTITMAAGPEADDGIFISVKDNGIGIDPEKQSHIFGAFQQADGSISRRHGGTGLGLTISQQLAHMMGGAITLESAPGEGACFTLHMPVSFDTSRIDEELIDIHSTETVVEESKTSAEPLAQPKILSNENNRHILVVDDDINTLLSITPLLERWGYRVSGAGDGEEALETLESEPDIALILMDIAMPVKDGYTTIQQIRNMPGISEIPVITMSCDDTNREHAVEGAKDHIHKPIDPDILQQTIERYIA